MEQCSSFELWVQTVKTCYNEKLHICNVKLASSVWDHCCCDSTCWTRSSVHTSPWVDYLFPTVPAPDTVSSVSTLIFVFLLVFVLPVTWTTARSLKYPRTAWTRGPSRSDPNALSCSRFWEKAVTERWDSPTTLDFIPGSEFFIDAFSPSAMRKSVLMLQFYFG